MSASCELFGYLYGAAGFDYHFAPSLWHNWRCRKTFGLALVLSSFGGVASIVLLSKVLDLVAKLNSFMQRQAADLSRLPLILDSIEKVLKLLKENGAD